MANKKNAPAAEKINILIPVWGVAYVNKWIDISLPTLLASGNLPAMAAEYPTTVTLLSDERSFRYFKSTNACLKLAQLVKIEFVDISDLLGKTTYSVALTQAFARGMFGENAHSPLTTAYVLLVGDYIFSDGSLRTLVDRIRAGHRAIFQGNFGVKEESVSPIISREISRQGGQLEISARDLMKLAINEIHPVTAARFVDQEFVHHSYPNRFFWKVGRSSLIGRFFLLHPLCLVPEQVIDCVEGFCDYSLFPSTVPSLRYTVLDDSDDFFILECEPTSHESKGITLGRLNERSTARHLSHWTTAQHRSFAQHAIFYCGSEADRSLKSSIERNSMEWLTRINTLLRRRCAPLRGHPYWKMATAGLTKQTFANRIAAQAVAASQDLTEKRSFWRRLRYNRNAAPFLNVWQFHWPDYVEIRKLYRELEEQQFFLHHESNTCDALAFKSLRGSSAHHLQFDDTAKLVNEGFNWEKANLPAATHVFCLKPCRSAYLERISELKAKRPNDRFIVFSADMKTCSWFDILEMNLNLKKFVVSNLCKPVNGKWKLSTTSAVGKAKLIDCLEILSDSSHTRGRRLGAYLVLSQVYLLQLLRNILVKSQRQSSVRAHRQFYSFFLDLNSI